MFKESIKINNSSIPAVVFSEGAEIITVSIAEELFKFGIPIILFSLGKKSLLYGLKGVINYKELKWPPNKDNEVLNDIVSFFEKIKVFERKLFPVFATGDASLRFILENRDVLGKYLLIPSSRLKLNGLDKAELFEFLIKKESTDLIPETYILSEPSDIFKAFEVLGKDIIIKPSLKPLSINLSLLKGSKVIESNEFLSYDEVYKRLKEAWNVSEKWVAQKKLDTGEMGEALWWGIRNTEGKILGITAYEKFKYPRMGGTACLVETSHILKLEGIAERILNLLGFAGICEIPFLLDRNYNFRMLELNPRPWLQVGLPFRAGFPVVYLCYNFLLGKELNFSLTEKIYFKSSRWVNIERLVLSALSGEYGNRLVLLLKALKSIFTSTCKVIYDSYLPKIKFRWIGRMLAKIFNRG